MATTTTTTTGQTVAKHSPLQSPSARASSGKIFPAFKRAVMVLVPLVAFALGGYFLLPSLQASVMPGKKAEPLLTATARRVSMPVTISAGGELASVDAVQVICEVEGQDGPKIIEMLPEGTLVQAGQIVMQLDPSQINENLAQQQITVAQSEGLARAVGEELKIQKNLAESQIAAAELAVKLAKLDREKYIKGEYQAELNDIQGLIALAESELEDAKAELDHFGDLVKKGFSTPEQLRSKEQAVKRAEHNLSRDQGRLEVLEKYTRERQVVELEAKAIEAQREVERAKSTAAAAIAKAETDLEVAQATADLERRQLMRIETQLELCAVRAPSAGTVIYTKERSKPIELGAEVRYKQKLFSLPSSNSMEVNAFVHEAFVKQVQPGMKAEVRIDAFPNLPLAGTVQNVAAYYDSTRHWLSGGVKEYSATISIDALSDAAVRSGMSAEVLIHVAELSDTLVVPLASVAEEEGQHYCCVVSGETIVPTAVKIGVLTDEYVEIVDGLTGGEQVALDARRRLRSNSKEEKRDQ